MLHIAPPPFSSSHFTVTSAHLVSSSHDEMAGLGLLLTYFSHLLLLLKQLLSLLFLLSTFSFLNDCGLQKVDTTARAVLDIMTKTTEYLQPNPGDIYRLCMKMHAMQYIFVEKQPSQHESSSWDENRLI